MDNQQQRADDAENLWKPLKDVDAVERARMVFALSWLLPACAVFFAFITIGASNILGLPFGLAVLVGFLLGVCFPLLFFWAFQHFVAGRAASIIYYPGSTGTPLPPSYWRAQALSARGAHGEALQALEAEVDRDPADPGPCLRAAALCLRELGQPEEAIYWYLRAREAEDVTPETLAYVAIRLADLHESQGREELAELELRRLLRDHPDSPYAPGSRARLAAIKRRRSEGE